MKRVDDLERARDKTQNDWVKPNEKNIIGSINANNQPYSTRSMPKAKERLNCTTRKTKIVTVHNDIMKWVEKTFDKKAFSTSG